MPSSGRARRIVAPAVLLVAFLLLWQWYGSSLGSTVLPPPSRVVSSAWDDRADLVSNSLPTLRAALLGFALALVVGFLLSVIIDFWGAARDGLMPLLIISQTLPLIVLAPLMVLWFGFGLLPKVLLVALVTFFPITVALVRGYTQAAPLHELAASVGATRRQEFITVRLPVSVPSLFTGLRIAITYAIVAAVFAEYAGATAGLGIYMQVAKNSFRTDLVLAAVVVSAALTLVLYLLTYAVERLSVPWARRR